MSKFEVRVDCMGREPETTVVEASTIDGAIERVRYELLMRDGDAYKLATFTAAKVWSWLDTQPDDGSVGT